MENKTFAQVFEEERMDLEVRETIIRHSKNFTSALNHFDSIVEEVKSTFTDEKFNFRSRFELRFNVRYITRRILIEKGFAEMKKSCNE